MYQSTNEGVIGNAAMVINTISDLIKYAQGDGEFQIPEISGGSRRREDALKTYSYSSAAKAASKLIAVFPILMSRTVSAETAQKVRRYIEQKGCIIIMLALQQANISNATNGIEYLRKFHQNLNIGGDTIDAVSQAVETWADTFDLEGDHGTGMRESFGTYDDSAVYEADNFTIPAKDMKQLLEMFKANENIQFYDTSLNEASIDDIMNSLDGQGDIKVSIQEARSSRYPDAYADQERRRAGLYDDLDSQNNNSGAYSYEYYKRNKEIDKSEREARNDRQAQLDRARKLRDQQDSRDRQARNDRWAEEDRAANAARQRMQDQRDADDREYDRLNALNHTGSNVGFLKDQDIKKMNDAVPSLLLVRFYSDSTARVSTEFIIGIKAKVVSCNTDEILRRIENNNKDGKFFFNLMRTMTGELRASEFLFGLSRINDDLKSTRKKGSHGDTWKMLENRARAAKAAVRGGKLNNFAAITTVVLSKEDANALYREENLDITDAHIAKRFMESYNLLGLAIVDDATESILIKMDDGNNYFEELSYKSLEREGGNSEMKKLLNLISSSR